MWAWIFHHSGIRWLFRHTNWQWVENLYFEVGARAWGEEEERLVKSGYYKDLE